jgi:hypothetical protein
MVSLDILVFSKMLLSLSTSACALFWFSDGVTVVEVGESIREHSEKPAGIKPGVI